MSYGVDILMTDDLVVGPNGDLMLARGKAVVRQDVLHRLITSPGELLGHPDFGAGLRRYLQDEDAVDLAVQAAQEQIENDPRVDVDSVKVVAKSDIESMRIVATFELLEEPGEENLVLVWDKERGELRHED